MNPTPPVSKALPSIVYISSEQYPHHNTDTQQIVKNTTALHEAGLDIELLIPVQYRRLLNWSYDTQAEMRRFYNVGPGLKITELWGFPASPLRLEKFFHAFFATLYVLFRRPGSIIYTRNKRVAIFGFMLGKRIIFETYRKLGDEFPRLMRFLAKYAGNNKLIVILTHSNVAAESMLRMGFPKEKLLVLHNGVDNSDMLPILSKTGAREKLKLDINAKYVVYTGNMQKNKCIESLVDIAAHLPDITFLLVGGKAEDLARLTAYCEAKKVKNVMLLERLPINEVSPYLYAADALIIPPVSAPMEKFGKTVLPFKLFPYLAAGRPIIAPNLADMRELIQHGENGILVNPDDAEQNAEAIQALLSDEQMQKKLAANAAETSRSLTWEARAEKFRNWVLGIRNWKPQSPIPNF